MHVKERSRVKKYAVMYAKRKFKESKACTSSVRPVKRREKGIKLGGRTRLDMQKRVWLMRIKKSNEKE